MKKNILKKNMIMRSMLLTVALTIAVQPTAAFGEKPSEPSNITNFNNWFVTNFNRFIKDPVVKHPVLATTVGLTGVAGLALLATKYFAPKKVVESNENCYLLAGNGNDLKKIVKITRPIKRKNDIKIEPNIAVEKVEQKTNWFMSRLYWFTGLFSKNNVVKQQDDWEKIEIEDIKKNPIDSNKIPKIETTSATENVELEKKKQEKEKQSTNNPVDLGLDQNMPQPPENKMTIKVFEIKKTESLDNVTLKKINQNSSGNSVSKDLTEELKNRIKPVDDEAEKRAEDLSKKFRKKEDPKLMANSVGEENKIQDLSLKIESSNKVPEPAKNLPSFIPVDMNNNKPNSQKKQLSSPQKNDSLQEELKKKFEQNNRKQLEKNKEKENKKNEKILKIEKKKQDTLEEIENGQLSKKIDNKDRFDLIKKLNVEQLKGKFLENFVKKYLTKDNTKVEDIFSILLEQVSPDGVERFFNALDTDPKKHMGIESQGLSALYKALYQKALLANKTTLAKKWCEAWQNSIGIGFSTSDAVINEFESSVIDLHAKQIEQNVLSLEQEFKNIVSDETTDLKQKLSIWNQKKQDLKQSVFDAQTVEKNVTKLKNSIMGSRMGNSILDPDLKKSVFIEEQVNNEKKLKGNFKKTYVAIKSAITKMANNALQNLEQKDKQPKIENKDEQPKIENPVFNILAEIRKGINLKKVKDDYSKQKDILPDPDKLKAEEQKNQLMENIGAKYTHDSDSDSDFSSGDESEDENNETKVVGKQTIEEIDEKKKKVITLAPTVKPKNIGGIIGAFVNKFESLSKNDNFIKPPAENKTVVKKEIYINNNCEQNRMKFCDNAKDLLQAILRRNPDYQQNNIEKSPSTNNILNDNQNK